MSRMGHAFFGIAEPRKENSPDGHAARGTSREGINPLLLDLENAWLSKEAI